MFGPTLTATATGWHEVDFLFGFTDDLENPKATTHQQDDVNQGRDQERADADLRPEPLLSFLKVDEISFAIVSFHGGSGWVVVQADGLASLRASGLKAHV